MKSQRDLQLQRAELQKKARELDAQEPYLLDIKILEETISVKQKQLARIRKEVSEAETEHSDKLKELEKVIADKQTLTSQIEADIIAKGLARIDAVRELAHIEKEKKVAQTEIDDRHRYQNEQEKLIADALEDGNLKLKGVGFEIRDVEERKEVVIQELYGLNQDKSKIIDEIALVHDRFLGLTNDYIDDKIKKQQVLQKIEDEIFTAKQEYETVLAKTEKKLRKLDLKERSLLARESAVQKEEKDLQVARRRLEGVQSLYES